MRNVFWFAGVYFISLVSALAVGGKLTPSPTAAVLPPPVVAPTPVDPGPYNITNQVPTDFMPYTQVVQWMQQWNKEAPEITEFGTYGENRRGTKLHFLRLGTPGKPKILIHACIHGNEKMATACTVGLMGTMLHEYKRKENVTWLVKNRDIYFVPVFSPESYLRSRHIEEGDPNRRWAYPGSSTNNGSSPIQAMQKWFLEMKFVGVVDGHSWGRDFFYPSIAKGNDRTLLSGLAEEMGDIAGYSSGPVGRSPAGYAVDWYYWKGAASILTEFGTRSHNMPKSMIPTELAKTYPAHLHFMKRAPEVQAKLQGPSSARATNPPQQTHRQQIMRYKWRDCRRLRRFATP